MSSPTSIPLFFAGMSQQHIVVLRQSSTYAEFGSGDVIFRVSQVMLGRLQSTRDKLLKIYCERPQKKE